MESNIDSKKKYVAQAFKGYNRNLQLEWKLQ